MMLIPIRLERSAIHGFGLFALETIPMGTPIWRYEPLFDQEISPTVWRSLPMAAQHHLRWYSFVRSSDRFLIKGGDHSCFMNHSDQPNTGVLVGQESSSNAVTTVALRDIATREELTCDYWAFDADAPWKFGKVPKDAELAATS